MAVWGSQTVLVFKKCMLPCVCGGATGPQLTLKWSRERLHTHRERRMEHTWQNVTSGEPGCTQYGMVALCKVLATTIGLKVYQNKVNMLPCG